MSKEHEASVEFTTGAIAQGDIAPVAKDHATSPLPSPSFTCPLTDECRGSSTPISAAGVEHTDAQCESNPAEELMHGPDSGIQTEEGQIVAARGRGRYEYMDIRRCDSTEGEDTAKGGSPECVQITADAEAGEVSGKNQWVEEEKGKSHNTNKALPLPEVSEEIKFRPAGLDRGGEKVEDYEDMILNRATSSGWEQANYQNLPPKTNAGNEEADGDRCIGIGDYIKVCTVVGDPSGSTSFDNPDYWHSRLFLKADAVRT